MVVTGLFCLILSLLGYAVWIWIAVLGAGLLTPVAYSLFHYKRLEKRGELDVAV